MDKFYINHSAHELLKAARIGDMEFINDAIKNKTIEQNDLNLPNQMFIFAGMYGHLKVCEALFQVEPLRKRIDNISTIRNVIGKAFSGGHVEVVYFLLEKLKSKKCNINGMVIAGVLGATTAGKLDVVKNFLVEDSPYGIMEKELKESSLLHCAFGYSHLHIVKYLLEESVIKEKYDLHMLQDSIFKVAYKALDKEPLKYLIFERNIEKTIHIESCLKTIPSNDLDEVTKWFKIRELNKSLEKELTSVNNLGSKKIKV